jgi:hypothetical protein
MPSRPLVQPGLSPRSAPMSLCVAVFAPFGFFSSRGVLSPVFSPSFCQFFYPPFCQFLSVQPPRSAFISPFGPYPRGVPVPAFNLFCFLSPGGCSPWAAAARRYFPKNKICRLSQRLAHFYTASALRAAVSMTRPNLRIRSRSTYPLAMQLE